MSLAFALVLAGPIAAAAAVVALAEHRNGLALLGGPFFDRGRTLLGTRYRKTK